MASSDILSVCIQFLDNTESTHKVQLKSFGNALLQSVIKELNLVESDYFGLLFCDKDGIETFLNPLKKIKLQLPNKENLVLQFVVKFFPPDPGQLHEEFTRYLFALQVKRDIEEGKLDCNEDTLISMAAYIAQSEFGDWNEEECTDLSYLKDLKILPAGSDNSQLLMKVSEHHKTLVGFVSSQADSELLVIARKVEMYGLRLHPAKDQEHTDIKLSAAHEGVVVFQGNSKINTFNWSHIRKLSFKKKRFLIKLKSEANPQGSGGSIGDVIVFLMTSRDACKAFWRQCIEHHAFFRLESRPEPKPQPRLLKRGSTFRYSGKTQRQLSELVRNSNFRRAQFDRVSRRKSSMRSSNSTRSTPALSSTGVSRTNTNDHGKVNFTSNGTAESTVPSTRHCGDVALTSLESGGESWQVESGNLHSNVVSTQADEIPREAEMSEDWKDEEVEVDGGEEDASSSLLHSGGATSCERRTEVLSKPTEAPPSPPHHPSPSALLSTSDLKSTSSPCDPKSTASQIYFIVKELFMTERTYVKDLRVINTCFRSNIQSESRLIPENIANRLFGGTESLLSIHIIFLQQLESKLKSCEGGEEWDVDDGEVDAVILKHVLTLSKYLESLEDAESLINDLENLATSDVRFETAYRGFELTNVCYIPFSSFLLKPMQRVAHYKMIIDNLLHTHASTNKPDLEKALLEVDLIVSATQPRLQRAHNLQKLAQLRRDLIGADNLLNSQREFIREGSLYKLSRKGFLQRLFFLFSDCILYTSKGVTGTNQFKVHGELPLKGMIIEINEGEGSVPNCFSLLAGSKTVIVAASNQEEMDKWMEDFSVAIEAANRAPPYQSPLTHPETDAPSRLSSGLSSDDGEDSRRCSMDAPRPLLQQRSNATMHVCWHRNTSVSQLDHLQSLQNQLSGYLLRKFKNSDGWQKLWVVFSNFCLFFYKSYQDEEPLASLPLLGYSVSLPTEQDSISKDCVFKLQYKTHVYFFRAESEYTFNRWHHVICSTTVTSHRTRMFSRMTSE